MYLNIETPAQAFSYVWLKSERFEEDVSGGLVGDRAKVPTAVPASWVAESPLPTGQWVAESQLPRPGTHTADWLHKVAGAPSQPVCCCGVASRPSRHVFQSLEATHGHEQTAAGCWVC